MGIVGPWSRAEGRISLGGGAPEHDYDAVRLYRVMMRDQL